MVLHIDLFMLQINTEKNGGNNLLITIIVNYLHFRVLFQSNILLQLNYIHLQFHLI